MIKNIIFDMGNVLLTYNPDVPLKLYCQTKEERTVIKQELFDGPEWVQGDLGNITNEGKYESVKARIPQHMHESLKKCIYGWQVCIKPVSGAFEFCEYAKQKGYRIYVLSNASDEFYDYFPKFLPFDYFDGIVISSDVHAVKPDVRIYRHILDAYQLVPDECLFIDDMEKNAEGAGFAGMKSTVFRNDFEEIKKRFCL